jgi:hypothetical protein
MDNCACRIESLDRQRMHSKSVWPWENVAIDTITIHRVRGRGLYVGVKRRHTEIESDLGRIHSHGFNSNRISCNRNVYSISIDELVIEEVV